jgi:hypothetical protein
VLLGLIGERQKRQTMKRQKLIIIGFLILAIVAAASAGSFLFTTGSVSIATTQHDETLTINGSFTQLPVAPSYVGSVQESYLLLGSSAAVVRGSYAYVLSSYNDTLNIIDIEDPSNPWIVGSYTSETTLNDPRDLDVVGKYAYVACHSQGELVIFDVSDPTNPVIVGTNSVGGSLHDVKVVGRYAYTVNSGGTLNVVDVQDPTNPREIGTIYNASVGNIFDMEVRGSLVYVIARDSANTLTIYNISNPNAPTVVSLLQENGYFDDARSIDVVGGYVYVAGYGNDSISIVNVTDPRNPVVVGSLEGETELVAPWGITVVDQTAYVTSYQDYFCAVDVSDPTSPVLGQCYYDLTYLNNPGSYGFDVIGRYAYIANIGNARFTIMDVEGAQLHAAELGNVESTYVQTGELIVGNQLYAHGGLAIGAEGIHVDGDMVVARHSDENNFTSSTTGVAKTMYLTKTTSDGDHDCDDNPENCCAAGYHMCTPLEFLESGRRIDVSDNFIDDTPFNTDGFVDAMDNNVNTDCDDWTSNSADDTRYTCRYQAAFTCGTTAKACNDAVATWCCSD